MSLNGASFIAQTNVSVMDDAFRQSRLQKLSNQAYCDVHFEMFEWIAKFMRARREKDDGGADFDNPEIPAGYTYLGQLISHDLTMSTRPLTAGPSGHAASDIAARTPMLDLDTLYGGGPMVSPHLYERGGDSLGHKHNRSKFQLGWTKRFKDLSPTQNDLPRYVTTRVYTHQDSDAPQNYKNEVKGTLICDHRNEDNLLMSQLTVLFYRLHNVLVDEFDPGSASPPDIFEAARWLTSDIYRRVVQFDYLPRILGKKVCDSYSAKRLSDFTLTAPDAIPVEFTMGVMRTGHAMIRNEYLFPSTLDTNRNMRLKRMMDFKPIQEEIDGGFWAPRREEVPLKENWRMLNWKMFFEKEPVSPTEPIVHSKSIRAAIASQLVDNKEMFPPSDTPGELGDRTGGLVFRDLLRGFMNGLPDGFTLAKQLGVETINEADIAVRLAKPGADIEIPSDVIERIRSAPPLLFFLLLEAELFAGQNGTHLGPLGAKLAAETLFPALLLGTERDGPAPALVETLETSRLLGLRSIGTMSTVVDLVTTGAIAKLAEHRDTA